MQLYHSNVNKPCNLANDTTQESAHGTPSQENGIDIIFRGSNTHSNDKVQFLSLAGHFLVDRLTKCVRFLILQHSFTAHDVVNLFHSNIFKTFTAELRNFNSDVWQDLFKTFIAELRSLCVSP